MESPDVYIKILDKGILLNEAGPKPNPRECEFFSHNINYKIVIEDTTDPNDLEITIEDWWLIKEGNPNPRNLESYVPNNVDINKDDLENPIIEGNVLPLTIEQPGLTESDFNADEKMLLDGSNWDKIGRFNGLNHVFNFYLMVKFKVTNNHTEGDPVKVEDADGSIKEIPNNTEDYGYSVSDIISINVVKNHDIDNYIFARKYMDAGHELSYNGVVYSIENGNDEEFFNNHPGPFGGC